jgi:Uncharacterized conserved protein
MNKQGHGPSDENENPSKKLIGFLTSASENLKIETGHFISDPSDVETVHRMRLEIRKIRSVLFFLKKSAVTNNFGTLNDKLKQLNRPLAEIRDRDILIANCRRIQARDALIQTVSDERTSLATSLREQLKSKTDSLKLHPADWREKAEWTDRTQNATVPAHFKKEWIRLLKNYQKKGEKVDFSDPDQVHRFRIAGKKIKNILELWVPGRNTDFQKLYKQLRKMLRSIGDVHDLTASRRILAKIAENKPAVQDDAAQTVRIFKKMEDEKAKHLHSRWHKVKKKVKKCI